MSETKFTEEYLRENYIRLNNVRLGADVKIFSFVNAYGCSIDDNSKVGAFVEIQKNVLIGKNCKISSHTFICEGVSIEDNCFIGHGVMFTNDKYPRAATPDLTALLPSDPTEDTLETIVRAGATIGARAVIGPGLVLGRFSMVGMGAVVTRSVADFHLVAGQPARTLAAVGRAGLPLVRAVDGHLPDVDAVTLMWWMHRRVDTERLPHDRVVVQFDHTAPKRCSFWVVIEQGAASVCLQDPGYEVDALVTCTTPALARVFSGVERWSEAVASGDIQVTGTKAVVSSMPRWFLWSPWSGEMRAITESLVAS